MRFGFMTSVVFLTFGLCAFAQTSTVQFEPVDLSGTLDGSAYFLSLGPLAEAEFSSELGPLKGARALRVTLFQVERSNWIWVESLFFNRAGGAHVEWCASVHEADIIDLLRAPGSVSSEGFSWVDATTFEFYDDVQAIDPEKSEFVPKPRRIRFHLVDQGLFEISVLDED